MSTKEIMVGTVRWFDHKKGYGFLTASDGEEVFVHHKAIKVKGCRSLKADKEVGVHQGEDRQQRLVGN